MNLSDVALAAQTAQKESLTLAEKGIGCSHRLCCCICHAYSVDFYY